MQAVLAFNAVSSTSQPLSDGSARKSSHGPRVHPTDNVGSRGSTDDSVPRPDQNRSLKRKPEIARVMYPRKRALRACEACRKRKTKCDNQRPTCGGCQDLDIHCDFGNTSEDRSPYDHASLEILERINYAIELLEEQRKSIDNRPSLNQAIELENLQTLLHTQPTPLSLAYSEDKSVNSTIQEDAEILLESLEVAGRNPQVSEDIFDWPIFEGKYDRANIETLIFNPHASQASSQGRCDLMREQLISPDPIRTSSQCRGTQEEDVLPLIRKFLTNVHIKNPVLDPNDLQRKAKYVIENGFGWDTPSCLVLITCALASISSTFTSEPVTPSLVDGDGWVNSIADTTDYSTAETYYAAAQKRIGLLETSIPATQCYFLSGVYEMYSLRPMRAWTSFNRACITLQIFLRQQPHQDFTGSKGVERRLYWSCLKSECELRMEINLPPSGLAKAKYPDVFPTPPMSSPAQCQESIHGASSSAHRYESDTEIIWSYYLSEIAVRKIGNRLMKCFYEHDEEHWCSMPLNKMIRIADELELQLSQWFDNLPQTLIMSSLNQIPNDHVTEELQFVLRARLSDFRERIYRPFLYLAIKHSEKDPIQQILAPYVHRCISACLAWLQRGTPRHRHHGTWFENRAMFLKSLLLIAAVKSGKIPVPEVWRQGIDLCIAGFKYWEYEAPDLREARRMLQSLLADLYGNA